MTWRWVTFFSIAATAWCASLSGRIELAGSKASGRQKDNSGVVVWLELPADQPAPPSRPGTATIAHKNKTFVPHVVAIRTGSKVVFPNMDPFFHNAFSNYDGQTFDIGLHPPGSSREFKFTKPGIVRLFCNIH